MYGSNPYAQAGWPNPQNPLSVSLNPWFPNSAQSGPTYGALPAPSSGEGFRYSFDFIPAQPTVLNSTVLGPGHNVYFRVVTTNDGITTILKPRDQLLARIEWGSEPTVEIREGCSRQRASQWLPLSQDQSYRTMTANGRNYIWVPRGDAIMLYSAGSNPPAEYGAITRSATSVSLKLTGDAFSAGVLEAAVVATLIFQSGRNIA
ncbi:hypothetical protein FA13DRAFT_1711925 [Coprinellus micaceus]|uniref:DUF6593 domain-containing protein n=1 Tax=Coprinellus micaceus TaxID=71717 RepID=A0A4Y7T327_COPMI|nr:hypothetical protein FA13DRAFT_1649702 [Coprinellus micaceus]TEB28364.1 hypothetical protein FA13DRAFT_1711925 [Coprinellus micaceus]